jgi:cytosine/adenosine deaminase-related metal-dependent hydrolase
MNYALQARWIVPIDRPPIAGGIVSVADGRIVAVGENVSGRPPTDLGDVALLPGFVNAHTHLEFNLLERPLGTPGMAFADWIGRVVDYRQSLVRQFVEQPEEMARLRQEALWRGLAECVDHAVAAIGEISTRRFTENALEHVYGPPHCTAFLELLGLDPQRAAALLEMGSEYLAEAPGSFVRGLSPHAPYTIGLPLLTEICSLSHRTHCPLAMHLAESREELELLAFQRGPLVEWLENLESWHPAVVPPGTRPLDYLQRLAAAHRALVIHGNYLDSEEIDFVAARADRLAVVYCPRTHAYFEHGPYPLRRLLDAGVAMAIGTDSRASNPDLSVLAELRHTCEHHREVSPAEIVELGTLAGARALGVENDFGSITGGKRAVFAIVKLDGATGCPYEQVVAGTGRAVVHPDRVPGEVRA